MIQILFGDEGHRARCVALAAVTPGPSPILASGPAFDKKALKLTTLTFWGHGDARQFSGMTAVQFVAKVAEWVKWNPLIKTVEIITCNSRHSTIESKRAEDGTIERSWVKSYTDQVKTGLKKLGLTVKALPMGISGGIPNRWSVLKSSSTTGTWLYVTGNGETDKEMMWPGVNKVENSDIFKASKNYVTAGEAVKAADTSRNYTIDFGITATLRAALVVLA